MQPDDFQPTSSAVPPVALPTQPSMALPVTTDSLSSAALSIATVLVSSFISSTTFAPAVPPFAPFDSKPADPPPGDGAGECKLLGPFAVLIQGALGALALLSLVYKRWRERPQRPVKIWAFDASKQVFGSVLLHLANLLMSLFSAGQLEQALVKAAAAATAAAAAAAANSTDAATEEISQPNPCSFYLLNLAIDTTIGIPILIVILKVLTVGAGYTPLARPPESIKSGHYGNPPHATWWLKQSIIYFVGLIGMKTCVFFIFELCPWIVQVGDWALKWTEGNEAIQIAFVMLIFPLIMNALQYYIIDTFIKQSISKENTAGHAEETDSGEQGGLLADDSVDHRDSIDDDESLDARDDTVKPGLESRTVVPYDPDKDGRLDTDEIQSGSSTISNTATTGLEARAKL